jgi:aconitate hydratase
VPPATGIVHQVNLEYLASVVLTKRQRRRDAVAYPDSLVGTDSHTTMINGLGVLGWGVGGIEAEAVMLGQPIYMLTPEVIGFKLTGELPEGRHGHRPGAARHRDAAQEGRRRQVRRILRPRPQQADLADRATIGNMAPEYGATMGFFPVDEETLRYLRHRSQRRAGRAGGALLQRAGPLPHRRTRPTRNLPTHWNWTWARSSRRWPAPSARRIAST